MKVGPVQQAGSSKLSQAELIFSIGDEVQRCGLRI
jgi:hypothetical protein